MLCIHVIFSFFFLCNLFLRENLKNYKQSVIIKIDFKEYAVISLKQTCQTQVIA